MFTLKKNNDDFFNDDFFNKDKSFFDNNSDLKENDIDCVLGDTKTVKEDVSCPISDDNICSLSTVKEESVRRVRTGEDGIDWLYGYSEMNNQYHWGLPKGKISIWGGEAGVGKSRVAIAASKSIIKNGMKVLYFQAEIDLTSFKSWVMTGDKIENLNNFLVSGEKKLSEQIRLIRKYKPDIVFVDSINKLKEFRSGTEKDIELIVEGDETTEGFRSLGDLDAHIIFISHLNGQGNIKGNTDLPHSVDTLIQMTHAPQTFEYSKSHIGLFFVEVGKNRYGKTGSKTTWVHRKEGPKCGEREFDEDWRKSNYMYKEPSVKMTRKEKREVKQLLKDAGEYEEKGSNILSKVWNWI